MFNIHSYKGYVNESNTDMESQVRIASIKKIKNNKCWQESREYRILIHLGENVSQCSHYGNQVGG
jgi:hypothetical protein